MVVVPGAGRAPLLVAGLIDGTVTVRDTVTGDAVTTLRGHSRGVTALAEFTMSSGCRLLVTGSADGTVRLWDLNDAFTPRLVVPLGMEVHAMAPVDDDLALGTNEGLVVITVNLGAK